MRALGFLSLLTALLGAAWAVGGPGALGVGALRGAGGILQQRRTPPRARLDAVEEARGPTLRGTVRGEVSTEEVVSDAAECLPRDAFEEREQILGWRGYPPDPLLPGSCRVVLHFVDMRSRELVFQEFELWHLDAPATEHWEAGARMRAGSWANGGTAVVEDLPAGQYRAVAIQVAPGQEDPPVFAVEGNETEVWLEILPPRTFRTRLQVRDETGQLVPHGEHRVYLCGGSEFQPMTPPWATLRRVRADGRALDGPEECHWDGEGGDVYEAVEADDEGMLMDASWKESRRHSSEGSDALYRFEGRTEIHLDVDHEGLQDRLYVGVTVPPSWVRARICHFDGRRLCDADGLAVLAWCDALLLADGREDPHAWQRLPLQVLVTRDGERVGGGTLWPAEPDRLLYLPRLAAVGLARR